MVTPSTIHQPQCDYLCLSEKVDIIVFLQQFTDEVRQDPSEAFVDLQPGGVKAEAERGPVGLVVTVEVVSQHPSELGLVVDIGAGGDQVTPRQSLVKRRVISPVQLIDGHLPDTV